MAGFEQHRCSRCQYGHLCGAVRIKPIQGQKGQPHRGLAPRNHLAHCRGELAMKQPSCKQIYLKVGFQRGLSLIELMISITIGLLILASLSVMFVNQSKTRVELDKSNRMI